MSTLKVNRIEPRTGSNLEILGFGGGVSNLHKSFRNARFDLPNGVWTRVLHNVNSIPNPSFSIDTGIFTVGSGEGGWYYVNWNCCFESSVADNGLRATLATIKVNDQDAVRASSDSKQTGTTILMVPVTSLINLQDGDEVTLYAYGEGNTSGSIDQIVGSPGVAYSSWTMFRIGDGS